MAGPNNESDRGLSADEIKGLTERCAGDIYDIFVRAVSGGHPDGASVKKEHFYLRPELLAVAISDASTDIRRAAGYHSKSGASNVRVASYIGWWIAHTRPIQLTTGWDVKQEYNEILARDIMGLNAIYAVYCIIILLDKPDFQKEFLNPLRYTLHFRPRHDPEAISVMINAALSSPKPH